MYGNSGYTKKHYFQKKNLNKATGYPKHKQVIKIY